MSARYKSCDGPECSTKFDTTTGMDHWFEATEFDTTSMDERAYCSRKCLVRDQEEELKR